MQTENPLRLTSRIRARSTVIGTCLRGCGLGAALIVTLSCCGQSFAPIHKWKRAVADPIHTVESLAFSPDGKVLAIGSSAPSPVKGEDPGDTPLPEGTIELWDPGSGTLTSTLRQSARSASGDSDSFNKVGALAFSPDGRWLVGGDVVGYTLWELSTRRPTQKWRSGNIEALSAAWSPDGKRIGLPTVVAPGLPDYELSPWGVGIVDAAGGKVGMFSPVETGYARSARFSPDGRLLAAAGHDSVVRVFDVEKGTSLLEDHTGGTLFAVGFSPDGQTMVAGPGMGGVLLRYKVGRDGGEATVTKNGTSSAGAGEIHDVQFSPDGRKALSNSDGRVVLWDAVTWASFKTLPKARACLSADGRRIAVVKESAPAEVGIWDSDVLENSLPAPGR